MNISSPLLSSPKYATTPQVKRVATSPANHARTGYLYHAKLGPLGPRDVNKLQGHLKQEYFSHVDLNDTDLENIQKTLTKLLYQFGNAQRTSENVKSFQQNVQSVCFPYLDTKGQTVLTQLIQALAQNKDEHLRYTIESPMDTSSVRHTLTYVTPEGRDSKILENVGEKNFNHPYRPIDELHILQIDSGKNHLPAYQKMLDEHHEKQKEHFPLIAQNILTHLETKKS